MPSVFLSYSHDPDNPGHAEGVAGLAASLLRDGLEVFLDQKRDPDEEGIPWPIWMESRIDRADHVLMVCTDLYRRKVRQEVDQAAGRGVLWEANLIYNRLYLAKLNTAKFVPVLFAAADEEFIPGPLQGASYRFLLDSEAGYARLYAFLTGRHRAVFPQQGEVLVPVERKAVRPLFGPPVKDAAVRLPVIEANPPPAEAPGLTLRPNARPAPRRDVRGLDWYEECDAGHFLGRDDVARSLVAMLLDAPVVRLVGPSGVGKSSLIRAGLLPKIRECGWRACVVRPFDDPVARLLPQLSGALLDAPTTFTAPFDPSTFRREAAAALVRASITHLVVLLDQFEDVVSPLASPEAVDAMRDFLRDVWERRDEKPRLRVVAVYRTDADARLGRLWQEVSGRAEGLPYLPLVGLDREATVRVVEQTAKEQSWRLDVGAADVVRELVQESRKLDTVGDVFPVYLQIFLQQAQQLADGLVTADFLAGLGGVAGLIGKFLEQTLARLKARGGDWERCGDVLEALSRSTGARAVRSLDDLVRESGIGRPALVEMLAVLVNERLVRPVGNETYEIQHDRLAAAVIASLSESDREAKQARDFLAAKTPTFERTKAPLARGDLHLLYRHRRRIQPNEAELRVVLATLAQGQRYKGAFFPGWFWFRDAGPADWLRRCVQLERWSVGAAGRIMPLRNWRERLPLEGLDDLLPPLADDPLPKIRSVAARLLGRAGGAKFVDLLRRLASEESSNVRLEATRALSGVDPAAALAYWRELAKSEEPSVRIEAATAIETAAPSEALPVWRDVGASDDSVTRVAAARALSRLAPAEAVHLWRQVRVDEDVSVSFEAAKELALAEGAEVASLWRSIIANVESDEDREAMTKSLSEVRPARAPGFWRALAEEGDESVRATMVNALYAVPAEESLPLLRSLAADADPDVQLAAARALSGVVRDEALALLRSFATMKERYYPIEVAMVLETLAPDEALPLWREILAEQGDLGVRTQAARALSTLAPAEGTAAWRDLALEEVPEIRLEAARALSETAPDEALPLWREFVTHEDADVRFDAAKALLAVAPDEARPLWRELVLDDDSDMRTRAAMTLRTLAPNELERLVHELESGDDHSRLVAAHCLADGRPKDALALLPDLACSPRAAVSEEAARLLIRLSSRDALEVFLDKNDQRLSERAVSVLDEALYMPDWLRAVPEDDDEA